VLRNVGYDATSWYLDNLNINWNAVYSNEPCSCWSSFSTWTVL